MGYRHFLANFGDIATRDGFSLLGCACPPGRLIRVGMIASNRNGQLSVCSSASTDKHEVL
jgi:hypothetical protein